MPRRNATPRPGGIDYLIQCVEEGEEPVTSLHIARETLAVVLAVYESARTGTPVRLSSPTHTR
jgi:predicted dehydrogenase